MALKRRFSVELEDGFWVVYDDRPMTRRRCGTYKTAREAFAFVKRRKAEADEWADREARQHRRWLAGERRRERLSREARREKEERQAALYEKQAAEDAELQVVIDRTRDEERERTKFTRATTPPRSKHIPGVGPGLAGSELARLKRPP